MAKRRAVSSPERRRIKIMTDSNGWPDGCRPQQKENALVEIPSAYLVGDKQEYYARPYYRSAPLFIRDLADHNLWEWKEFMELCACEQDARPSAFPANREMLFHDNSMPNVPPSKHILVEISPQTDISAQRLSRVVSVVCIRCLNRFVLRVDCGSEGSTCGHSQLDMFHELELVIKPTQQIVDQQKTRYYPVVSQAGYHCKNVDCGLTVVVQLVKPCIPYGYIGMLMEENRIQRRIKQAKIEHPERFQNVDTTEWASGALKNLWRYLDDLLTANRRTPKSAGQVRSFSKRVKRFNAVMGPEFYQLLIDLGYKETVVGDEEHFEQTLPDVYSGPTPPESYRGFIETCALELQIYEVRRQLAILPPDRFGDEATALKNEMIPASQSLEKALDCFQYPRKVTEGGLTYHYRFLGSVPNMTGDALYACFNRRLRIQGQHQDAFRDSLHSIARDMTGHLGRQADFLRKVASELPKDEGNDYAPAWGLTPIHNLEEQKRRTEDEVFNGLLSELRKLNRNTKDGQKQLNGKLELFRSYVDMRAPAKGCTRLKFKVLGWEERPDLKQPALPMLLELACIILDVDLATDSDEALWGKINHCVGIVENRKLLISALEAIHTSRGTLKVFSGEVQLDETARNIAELADRSADAIGLRNIGNTCYLNSILQYLYTIVPIRSLVENLDRYKLDRNDIASRTIRGTTEPVKPIELETALYFVGDALPRLFEDLRTEAKGPCTPSQGLANAVLLSMADLEKLGQDETTARKDGDDKTADPMSFPKPPSQNAPPLPARPNAGANAAASPSTEASSDVTVQQSADSGLPSPASSSATLTGDVASDSSFKIASKDGVADEASIPNPAGSDSSLSTAVSIDVDHDADGDTQMGGTAADETAAKGAMVKAEFDWDAFRRALPEKHNFPMNQQDVDEILGKVFGLLQAAVRPTGTDPDAGGVQMDEIVSNFYFKINRVMQMLRDDGSAKESSVISSVHRALTAYPNPDKALSIYEALDKWGFDPESIPTTQGETQLQFCSFKEPTPPFLHVLIQRTLGTGQKNSGIVQILEYLDIDRYMDAPEDSDLASRRRKYWQSKELEAKLLEIKAILESEKVTAPVKALGDLLNPDEFEQDLAYRGMSVAMLNRVFADSPTKEAAATLIRNFFYEGGGSTPSSSGSPQEETLASRVAGALETQTLPGLSVKSEMAVDGPSGQDGNMSEEAQVRLQQDLIANINALVSETQSLRDNLFGDLKAHRYALHAVICHSGTGTGGHYWVWIRDFESGLWRKYNDENTDETRSDTEALLNELNSKDFPYFVAYVRDADKLKLAGSPKREPREHQVQG